MRIVYNLKRLLQKVVGKNNLAQKIVTMFLLKEDLEDTTRDILLRECCTRYVLLNESTNKLSEDLYIESLLESVYIDY